MPAGDAEARRAAGDVGKGQNGLFWTALFQRWQTTQAPNNAARGLTESAHAWRVYRAAQDLKRCTGSLRPAHLKKWYKILVPLLREASRARTPCSTPRPALGGTVRAALRSAGDAAGLERRVGTSRRGRARRGGRAPPRRCSAAPSKTPRGSGAGASFWGPHINRPTPMG